MIAARERAVKKLRVLHPKKHRAALLKMLVVYANNQSHSSVEKASMIANVRIRLLEPGNRGSLRAEILQQVCYLARFGKKRTWNCIAFLFMNQLISSMINLGNSRRLGKGLCAVLCINNSGKHKHMRIR